MNINTNINMNTMIKMLWMTITIIFSSSSLLLFHSHNTNTNTNTNNSNNKGGSYYCSAFSIQLPTKKSNYWNRLPYTTSIHTSTSGDYNDTNQNDEKFNNDDDDDDDSEIDYADMMDFMAATTVSKATSNNNSNDNPIITTNSDSGGDTLSSSSSSSDNNNVNDNNQWISSQQDSLNNYNANTPDWQQQLSKQQNDISSSSWSSFSSFDSSNNNNQDTTTTPKTNNDNDDDDEYGANQWLDTIASISAQEINFINTENTRAEQALQMQQLGFSSSAITNTLGLEMDDTFENQYLNTNTNNNNNEDDTNDTQVDIYEQFKYQTTKSGFGMYLGKTNPLQPDLDLTQIESHTTVEKDPETSQPLRTQMVYVDEHTCIGCTNCAMIAQSTFYMESEHGRARVFQQWGDDDETIQIAIETCPVDCIHYVPFEELKRLEIERRDQNINFKARLVSQAEYSSTSRIGYGGGRQFTEPQKISGNMTGYRCNNCPSRGCKNCPMYGVGENPVFQQREKERKEKLKRQKMKEVMEDANRSADL